MASKQQVLSVGIFIGIPLLLLFIPKKVDTSEDGTYCAEVEYINPDKGTESTYTLPVEVEDDRLIRINFPNGGWLDDTHFEPEYIEDGKAKFKSYEGTEYKITLKHDGDCD